MNKISWGWVPTMKNAVFWKTELTRSHQYTTSRKRSLGSGSCGRYYEMGGSSVWTGTTRSSSPTKPRLGLLCKWYQIGSLGLVMFFFFMWFFQTRAHLWLFSFHLQVCQGGDPFFTNPGRSVERTGRLGINGLFFDSFSGFFASQLGDFDI